MIICYTQLFFSFQWLPLARQKCFAISLQVTTFPFGLANSTVFHDSAFKAAHIFLNTTQHHFVVSVHLYAVSAFCPGTLFSVPWTGPFVSMKCFSSFTALSQLSSSHYSVPSHTGLILFYYYFTNYVTCIYLIKEKHQSSLAWSKLKDRGGLLITLDLSLCLLILFFFFLSYFFWSWITGPAVIKITSPFLSIIFQSRSSTLNWRTCEKYMLLDLQGLLPAFSKSGTGMLLFQHMNAPILRDMPHASAAAAFTPNYSLYPLSCLYSSGNLQSHSLSSLKFWRFSLC